MPPAWNRVARRDRREVKSEPEEQWDDSDPQFDPQFAAKLFPSFPVEAWCQSSIYCPMIQAALLQLVAWTAERLMPSWRDRRRQRDRQPGMFEWNSVLGDLIARAAPYFDLEWTRQNLLSPFLIDEEEALGVLAAFADRTVTRHVFDAQDVSTNTLVLLNDCADRIIRDDDFKPGRYRAGEVNGYDMPKLIGALLFITVENAPGAARFANGDWSQIDTVMPLVTKLVTAAGWSPYVMKQFLILCERVGIAYPLETFAAQANAALGSVSNARGGWSGTTLPAGIATVVHRLSDAAFPLRPDQALGLLRVLDALIDLGDRRSAALEQSETFRGVQLATP